MRSVPDGAASLHRWWTERLAGLGLDRTRLVTQVTGRRLTPTGVHAPTAERMVDEALAALVERQSTWRTAELVRELGATVPTTITVDPERLTPWLDRLADQIAATRCVDISPPIPERVPTRRDGRPITEAAVDGVLTTAAVLDEDEQIIDWAERRLGDPPRLAPLSLPLGRELGARQQAVAAAVVDGPVDHAGVYTPMTRGRLANHAYVVTYNNQTAPDVLAEALTRYWIDTPAVAHRAEHDPLRRQQVRREISDDVAKRKQTGPSEAHRPGTSTDGSQSATTLRIPAIPKAARRRSTSWCDVSNGSSPNANGTPGLWKRGTGERCGADRPWASRADAPSGRQATSRHRHPIVTDTGTTREHGRI